MSSESDNAIEIGTWKLSIDDVEKLAHGSSRIVVAAESREKVEASRQMVVSAISAGTAVYGVTTGFGALSERRISPDKARELQVNLLRSHAAGTGPLLPDEVVRAMLGLRAHALALGHSGVRLQLIDLLVEMYNKGIIPQVPSQGSVGASGDLAPLAHLALPLTGEGQVRVNGRTVAASDGLREVGLQPLELEPKEALALINGTQTMTAIGALATVQAFRVIRAAIAAGAMTMVALNGRVSSIDELLQNVRPHQGQIAVAAQLRELLDGWRATGSGSQGIQDRYSLRAMPQVLGGILDTFGYTSGVLVTEINSVTDNPLFFPEDDKILNGANFHGHPVALACDHLKTAIASLTTFSERRIASLVDPRSSGLSAFLSPQPGLHTGLMIPHYVAASLVSENRVLAHPASVDSLSTSADVEDYNSMGALASRNLNTVVENASRVVAIELICAAQAIDLAGDPPTGAPIMKVYSQIRRHVPFLDRDQFGLGHTIDMLGALIRSGDISVPGSGSKIEPGVTTQSDVTQ